MNAITLTNVSKKYNRNWLFKGVNLNITSDEPLAITGYNGSGKSTLLKIISGYTVPTSGTITYTINDKTIEQENIFQLLAYASPYLDLIDEFTLTENISFYMKFKKLKNNISIKEFISIAFLEGSEDKQVKFFSSGMKQRLKISLALLADTPILLLDEPLSNLDSKGFQWYADLTKQHLQNRICIICSNNTKDETYFCKNLIRIEDYR